MLSLAMSITMLSSVSAKEASIEYQVSMDWLCS